MDDLWKYETEIYNEGYKYIGGVDEVGRGPLIGPVVTSCVVLPRDFKLDGLTDSKKLSEKKRNIYYDYIINNCIAYGIGMCTPEEIDEFNIYQASRIAMIRAIEEVKKKIPLDYILSDAMPMDIDIPVLDIIKGDAKSISIAAASVVAKVTRDNLMYDLDKLYPEYGFKNHKGYPTRKHYDALNKYGLIEGYRKTYGPVKKIMEGEKL